MFKGRYIGIGVLAAVGLSCDPPDENPSKTSALQTVDANIQYDIDTSLQRPSEDAFLQISQQFRFFAGFYCHAGNLLVGYTQSLNSQDALSLVSSIEASGANLYCFTREIPNHVPEVVLVPARYSFLALRSWRDTLTRRFLRLPNARGIGINYERNQIVMSVPLGGVEESNVLANSAGLAADAYAVVEQQATSLKSLACPATPFTGTTLLDCIRPVPAGVQIALTSNKGAVIGDCSVTSVNVRGRVAGYVSAGHCMSPTFSQGFDFVYQNQPDPANQIGTESVDPVGFNCGTALNPLNCRYSDSAWVSASTSGQFGTIAQTLAENGNTNPHTVLSCCDHGPCAECIVSSTHPRFYIKGSASAVQGMVVEKMGRTSGWTSGVVKAVCKDENDGLGHTYICNDVSDLMDPLILAA